MSQYYLVMNQGLRLSPQSFITCLVSWLGISALLVSTALAQVNGPGPSPANLFDTVINLPGDETIVPGSFGSLGGVQGQTTQLNIRDQGNLALSFEGLSGVEVNISGGTVGSGLTHHLAAR